VQMKKLRVSCFAIFFMLIKIASVHAQSDQIEFQTWFDITAFFNLGEKSAFGGDMGVRGIISSEDWNQYYIRPTFRYVFNPRLDIAGGAALFYTSNSLVTDLTEWRFFEEFHYSWPNFRYIGFNHRIRFEQRIFSYADEDPINFANHFSTRLRYSLMIETIDMDILNQKLYFMGGAEYFQRQSSDAESLISNSRFLVILGHRVNQRLRYEIHYIYQKSRIFQDDGLKGSEHIIRLRLYTGPKFLNSIDQ
jgi:hypothetical protein